MRYWRGYLTAGILAVLTMGLTTLAKRFSQLVDAFYPFLTREIQTTLAAWSATVDITVWQVAVMLILLGLLLSVVIMVALKWNFFSVAGLGSGRCVADLAAAYRYLWPELLCRSSERGCASGQL